MPNGAGGLKAQKAGEGKQHVPEGDWAACMGGMVSSRARAARVTLAATRTTSVAPCRPHLFHLQGSVRHGRSHEAGQWLG